MFNFFWKKKNNNSEDENKPVEYKENFTNISPVVEYFKNETGVSFEKQISILQNKVINFCRRNKIYSYNQLLQVIQTDENIKQDLINTLTTNETFFYREFKQIQELVELVKKTDGDIKILCAPSSTGEEPFSIAIALLEAGVSAQRFTITGVDINSDAIKKALKASYGERNVRNLSHDVINRYFNKVGDNYNLKDEVKSLVRFETANIFDESFKSIGKFDFVFSRNMLIYFDKETKQKAKTILESIRKYDTHDVFFGHADLF